MRDNFPIDQIPDCFASPLRWFRNSAVHNQKEVLYEFHNLISFDWTLISNLFLTLARTERSVSENVSLSALASKAQRGGRAGSFSSSKV